MESRTLLHALVSQLRWPFEIFQREYEKAAKQLASDTGDPSIANATIAEQTFRRWTGGGVRSLPRWPAPVILERMFGRSVAELLAPPVEGALLPPSSPSIDESEIRMTAQDAAGHAAEAAALSLSDIHIDQLEDDVRALARAYQTTTPAQTYRRGVDLLRTAQMMLDRTQRTRQRERLFLQAGTTAALLGMASFDLGTLPSAVQFARTAALYGEVIDHGPLRAYAHGALGMYAYWDGRPADALRQVTIAQAFGGLGDTASIRLAIIQGRAHAHLGDKEGAHRALQHAASIDTGRRDDLHDDIGGEFHMPPERAAMSAATTLCLLRDAPEAEEAAVRALALIDNQPQDAGPAVRSKACVDLARARLMRGELEGAVEAVDPVFELDTQWRIMSLVERLARLRGDLAGSGLASASAGRALGDRVEEFTALSGMRAITATAPLALEP